MHFNPSFSLLCVFFAVLDIAHAAPQRTGNNNGNGNANAATGGSGGTTLDAANIQDGSQQDGDPDATAGQSASLTDDANFINFCSGKTITNGLQNTGGSCNGIGEFHDLSLSACTNIHQSWEISPLKAT